VLQHVLRPPQQETRDKDSVAIMIDEAERKKCKILPSASNVILNFSYHEKHLVQYVTSLFSEIASHSEGEFVI
jgi:hypothetical protein